MIQELLGHAKLLTTEPYTRGPINLLAGLRRRASGRELAPRQGALQQILFDRLVAYAWNLNRILCVEAKLTASAWGYLDILDHPQLTAKLDRLARHQSRARKAITPSAM